MKFLTSAFVLFVLVFTSSTVSLAQKTRIEPILPRVESKSEIKQENPLSVKSESKIELKRESKKPQPAVEFSDSQAYSDGTGVYVKWKMVTETDNLGFQVFRVRKGETAIVEDKFTASASLRVREDAALDEEYSIFDPKGSAKDRYYVESYERNGNRTATKTFGVSKVDDISPIAGNSSSSIVQGLAAATGRESDAAPAFDPELQALVTGNLLPADPVNQKWVASQPGVKLGVRQTGMYRVTRAQLQAGGFDVNSDPNNWQLYTDGIEQAIIVEPAGNYIDFYGRGINTVESDTKMYYLLAGSQPGRRMANIGIRPSVSTVVIPSFDQTVRYEERFFYLVDVFNGDAANYFGRFISTAPTTPQIDLGPVDTTAASANVKVKILGFNATAHKVNVTLNGTPIGQATGPSVRSATVTLDVTVPGSLLVNGNNNLGLATVSGSDTCAFDSVEITYKRQFVASQNNLAFTMPNSRGATVHGFTSSNLRIFDTTFDANPAQLIGASIMPNGGTFDLKVPAYRNRAILAIDDASLLSPATITFNNPSTLSSGTHNGQLVIISYKDFINEANTWANYRRNQGFSVEVIDVDDVFDEFNYGVSSANSMRDFLDFTRTNWQTPPSYVLLIGDAAYDPRNYEGNGYWNLVPAKLVDTVFSETASDDAIVDFNNDGLAEMAIGRIPARTSAMVTNAYNKTVTFETLSATQNLSRGVIFHYDNAGLGWDFQGMSTLMANQLPAGTNNVFVPRADQNPNQLLVTEINNGRYFFNFNGHGTATSFANGANFVGANVPLLTNGASPTVFTLLTCLNGYFHNVSFTGSPSLSETLLNSSTGGAVASWASSGETTPDVQQLMGIHFYQKLGEGQITRLGDLIVDAKTVITAGRDVRLSWVLIGDPMLKVR